MDLNDIGNFLYTVATILVAASIMTYGGMMAMKYFKKKRYLATVPGVILAVIGLATVVSNFGIDVQGSIFAPLDATIIINGLFASIWIYLSEQIWPWLEMLFT